MDYEKFRQAVIDRTMNDGLSESVPATGTKSVFEFSNQDYDQDSQINTRITLDLTITEHNLNLLIKRIGESASSLCSECHIREDRQHTIKKVETKRENLLEDTLLERQRLNEEYVSESEKMARELNVDRFVDVIDELEF